MKCLLLYNPNSGRGKLGERLPYIKRILSKKYAEVEPIATGSAQELTARVRTADCDVIIAGGDGTLHAALQGAEGKRLGYLPAGTVNDYARSLGLPRKLSRALSVILDGRTAGLDCMQAGGERVAYVAAAGAFTAMGYATPEAQKRTLGPLAYALRGLKEGLSLESFPLRLVCDGRTTETEAVLILILNGRSVAGFPVNKEGSMRDGRLEVAVVRRLGRPLAGVRSLLSVGAVMLFGIRVQRRDVLFLQGSSVRVETKKDLVWDFDGERGPRGSLEVSLLQKGLELFVPRSKNYVKII